MSAPAVEVEDITRVFKEQVAVAGVSLAVQEGEFLSLLGPSGCGKTTLMRIISGFETPTSGRVRIHGKDVTDVPPHRRPSSIVFQQGALFPHMNVHENVAYPLKLKKWSRAQIADRVQQILTLVKLDHLAQRAPNELSGGQVQRAALARALAPGPEVLLLDEPLSALDLKLRQHMQLELRAIQRELGATFIYVTHDQTEALVMSDRVAIMNEGSIVQIGTPRDVYQRPTSVFASDFVGDTNLLEGRVAHGGPPVALVNLPSGEQVSAACEQVLGSDSKVTVSVRPESVDVRRATAGLPGVASEPSATDPDGPLQAVVGASVYLGNRVRLQLRTRGGADLWADLPDSTAVTMPTGTEVDVSWDPNAARAWPSDQSTSPA